MEINDLKQFVAVAKYENINMAANELFISPQAVSFTIKKIEKECKKPLFDRYKQRIHLNDFGKMFLIYANKVLSSSAELDSFIKHSNIVQPNSSITIDASTRGLMRYFSREYHSYSPQKIVLSNYQPDIEMVSERLLAHNTNVCFSYSPIHADGITSYPIMDKYLMVAWPKDQTNCKENIDIKELLNKKLVICDESGPMSTASKIMLANMGIDFISYNDNYLYEKALEEGRYVTIVSNTYYSLLSENITRLYYLFPIKNIDTITTLYPGITEKIYISHLDDSLEINDFADYIKKNKK